MAFSRSLSSRATLIARRYRPSFAYIFHDDDRKTHPSNEPQSPQKPGNFGQQGPCALIPFSNSQTPVFRLGLKSCCFFFNLTISFFVLNNYRYGVTPFTPFIQGPIFVSFFMAKTTFSGDLIALNIYLMMIIFISFIQQAIFCYWITSNLFSLGYGLVLKVPGVKKALGVPEIPKQPVVTAPRSSIDLYTALKQAKTASQQSTSLPIDPTEVAN
ncbi:hypothetical protein CXB51_033348 [Gossypium anomalum]|uniref:Uncharacterized protein n=1 Tax=Gossypium anomalum TaxID=47600 RepID=A0A8J6CL83_9ROSI|nr:hypothetical protein CXB51_033348 [Gossypium anomalum]